MEGTIEDKINYFKSISFPNDDLGIRLIQHNIKNHGVEWMIEDLLKDLDCTRLYNGKPICQTIDHTYKYNIGELLYIIEHYNINKIEVINRFVAIHERNLEYEGINPPIIYVSKNRAKKESRNKHDKKQTKMFDDVPTTTKSKKHLGVLTLKIK